jgi:phosphate transport system substrate-binding protein
MRHPATAVLFLLAALSGCGPRGRAPADIKIDGSSTVYLITEQVVSAFKRMHPGLNISIGVSGTGGGFKKFAAGETDIQNASRRIKPAEAEKCKANGIDYIELQVAWDGLAVIINQENTWAANMTVEQLKKIWHPNTGTFRNANKWKDVDPSWPDEEIKLYGAGPDSGTFDYFTEAINGKEKVIRTDYGASEDDNNILNGVMKNRYAMGFIGVAYYEGHKDKLRAVAVAHKKGAPYVLPEQEAVLSQRYRPLSRPLFIYVRKAALKRPEVRDFVTFYMRRDDLVAAAKYVPLTARQLYRQVAVLDQALAAVR